MTQTKSLCGAVNLLAAIFRADTDRLKQIYGLPVRVCPECGKYIPLHKDFCSAKCRRNHKYIQVACSYCGELFSRLASRVIYYQNHKSPLTGKTHELFFCNRKCLGKWLSALPRKRKWNYDEITQLLRDGLRVIEISRKLSMRYHVAHVICTRLIKRLGLPKPPIQTRKYDYEQVKILRHSGYKLREISLELNIPIGSVGSILSKEGHNVS